MTVGGALLAGGIYLKGTNPELGIVRPGEGNTEDKVPSLRRPGMGGERGR